MHTAIFRSGLFLALVIGASTATAQTELFFATGTDSTGRALAQSNADGHVLIESPQYPRGLWLHLVDEAGDALAGIRVEYQSRPDSLAAIHCVDPAGGVQETLVWTRLDGNRLRLTLKPNEWTDLPAALTPIDWQIDPTAEALLELAEETRLEGWEAVSTFLRQRWPGQTGRVAVQLDANPSFAIALDRPETIETLLAHLQQTHPSADAALGATIEVQVFEGTPVFLARAILYPPLFADSNLEVAVRRALHRPQGRLTPEDVASLTHLRVDSKGIQSLAGIEHLIALLSLDLESNQITDLTPLASLKKLRSLDLDNNPVTDLTPLASLNNLHTLGLESNQITDLPPLTSLKILQFLFLDSNQITDLTPLANLNNLHTLHLYDNQITDLTPLASLNNLEWLDLWENQITDLTPLASLNNLHTLLLNSNQIADATPLASLKNLRDLDLWENQITDLTPLASLNNLQRLQLGENQITDVMPLASLKNLKAIILYSNQIADVSPLVANTGLDKWDRVDLTDNPLSDQALNEQIPALQARGVRVSY